MMNKKTKTKILTLSAISALSLAAIWVLASNANNLLKFDWEVKQDAHLELSGVTLIAPTQSSNFDVSFKMSWDQLITLTGTNTARNSVQGNGTLSFWGSNNKTSDPESLILGGNGNEITNTAKENIIAASQSVKTAGESTTNYGKGNVILASSGVNLTGNGNILRAGNNTKIHGNDNLTLTTDKVNISANNSIAIGKNITINHNGSFVFNGTPDPVTTSTPNTAIINTSNGMIINANANTTTNNTGLTVNGSLQVGRDKQIDTDGAIILSDECIKLKGISNGEIGLGCRNSSNTDGPFLSFEGVTCGRNAKHYEINDSQKEWPLGSDFCSKGRLDGPVPKFFTSDERAAVYKTRGGSYASEEFGYTFHICFNKQDPTCAIPKLERSWTCSDSNGNRLHCEATQDSGKIGQKQTPVSCPSGQHLTNGSCVANTKTVNCDETGINTANGRVTTSQVAITRSEATQSWSKPAKCDFTCNNGYEKRGNQCVKDTPKETEMCTYHWETTQIRDTNGSYTRGICKQIKTNSEPIRPRPWWVNRWSEHPREEKILPYTTESECRKNGGFFEHRWSSRPEVLYRQECKDQKGNTTLDTSRCAPPFKEYPCQSATESPRPTPPPHPWKPETPPPRTWWNQGPPPRPWKQETPPTPQKCPKPVISNVDVSKDKIYFSAPNAQALTVNRSSDKIHWSNDTAWATSPRDYRYWKYIKITSHCNGWNIESDIFEVKNPKLTPDYHGKIDRNGNPFEWENNTIYDKNRQKIWIISKIIDCSPDTHNFYWSPIPNRLQCNSHNINDGSNWLSIYYGGNTRLLQFLVGWGTYYVPWIDNQRDKFNVEVIDYFVQDYNHSYPLHKQGSKITNVESHIWLSRK